MNSTDTNSGKLTNTTDSTFISPVAAAGALTDNTWGFYSPNASGCTTSSTFCPVPLNGGSVATLIDSATTGDNGVTISASKVAVTYGTKVTTALPANVQFTNMVLYTATTK
jgi:hypothetical protein